MKEKEKKVPCIVMSRVVGYLSPLHLWNKGKRQEWRERKTYSWRKAIEHASK